MNLFINFLITSFLIYLLVYLKKEDLNPLTNIHDKETDFTFKKNLINICETQGYYEAQLYYELQRPSYYFDNNVKIIAQLKLFEDISKKIENKKPKKEK